jgi:nucleoside-diphosphate-sugar epimerase
MTNWGSRFDPNGEVALHRPETRTAGLRRPADVAQMVGSIRIARDEFHYLFYAGSAVCRSRPGGVTREGDFLRCAVNYPTGCRKVLDAMLHLLCFGLGYSARVLAGRVAAAGWRVSGTSRNPAHERHPRASGGPGASDASVALDSRFCGNDNQVHRFDREHPLPAEAFAGVTHILVSAPPDQKGDPVLDTHRKDIAALPDLRWLGYLSTTGVYGDRAGGWVDETSELRPTGERGRRRAAAEAGWLDLRRERGVPVHVFRLAAIYGPGRGPFEALRAGTAKRLDKPGQVFSRIHVEDLASVLLASMARPRSGAVYNVCDDAPAPPGEVVAHAAALLGLPPPPSVPFEQAELSPMAKSFFDDNKRVANALIKEELGVRLRYPDYRAGLAAILAAETD